MIRKLRPPKRPKFVVPIQNGKCTLFFAHAPFLVDWEVNTLIISGGKCTCGISYQTTGDAAVVEMLRLNNDRRSVQS